MTKPNHILTRQSARNANACYSDEQLAEVIPEEGLTPAGVAALEIPIEDRIWALCRAVGADNRTLRLFACRCARRALGRVANPDPRSVNAVDVAERFANGLASREELRGARQADAAYAACVAAAADADAAYAAAADAAYADAAYAA